MIGQTLAHYEVLEKLGEGGMGAVYLARDTKLGREVALKILPDQFARDQERLARFHREARTLAALNHPNIAAIHGLETDGNVHFLVMELAPGEDLASRLQRGRIPTEEAVRIAGDIARGLEEAHAKGIIHRDLKPANVKVGEDGKVKLLDFGLARAFQGESTAEEESLNSPTITAAMTGAGVILGTAAYMSPEQARGTAVDRRSDIWSFGVVLFEMLTGRRVFQGETVSDTLAGILKSDPPWDALPDDTPDTVGLLLRRCLERDRNRRLQDIGEARILLSEDGVSTLYSGLTLGRPAERAGPPAAGAGPPRGRLGPVVGAVVAAVALGAAVGAVVTRELTPAPPAPPTRTLEIALPTEGLGIAADPAISPDGTMAVYSLDDKLWLRRLDTGVTLPLQDTGEGKRPFWSPDSRQVGYCVASKIMRLGIDGGAPVTVCEQPASERPVSGAWDDQDRILFTFTDDKGVLEVPARGGTPTVFLPPDTSRTVDIHDPAVIPGGRGLLYAAHLREGAIARIYHARAGRRQLVFDGVDDLAQRPTWSPDGYVLFEKGGANAGIWAVPYDPDAMETRGEAFLVMERGLSPSVSRDRTLLCATGASQRLWQLVRRDRAGGITDRYGEAQPIVMFFDVDDDGRRAVIPVREGSSMQLWLLDLVRGTQSRLTFDQKTYYGPTFSRDGRFVFAAVHETSAPQSTEIQRIAIDGSSPPRTLFRGFGAASAEDDGILTFTRFDTGPSGWNVAAVALSYPDEGHADVEVAGEPVVIAAEANWQFAPVLAPGGGLVAYVSRETGRDEVYLRRYPAMDGKRQVSASGGAWPNWSRDGRRLWFMNGRDIVEVSVQTAPTLMLGAPEVLFERPRAADEFNAGWPPYLRVGGDGESFYMLDQVEDDAGGRPLILVEMWSGSVAR